MLKAENMKHSQIITRYNVAPEKHFGVRLTNVELFIEV